MPDPLPDDVTAIGALAEPARRALYRYVVAQPEAVGREEAANAVDLPLHSAKFHLDRLVAEGLLDVEYRRLSGRSGPGAGRPSKLYRRSRRQLSLTLPPRSYDLAGEVLAASIDRTMHDGTPIADAVRDTAMAQGRRLASSFATPDGPTTPAAQARDDDPSERDDLARTVEVLAEQGYEPRTADGRVRLSNCPFDRLAAEHTSLVCCMNLALIDGVIDGLGAADVVAELAPSPGFCCVTVRNRTSA